MRKTLLILAFAIGAGFAAPSVATSAPAQIVPLAQAAQDLAAVENTHYRGYRRHRHYRPYAYRPYRHYRPYYGYYRPYYRPYRYYGYAPHFGFRF